jgi:hypothetical protein
MSTWDRSTAGATGVDAARPHATDRTATGRDTTGRDAVELDGVGRSAGLAATLPGAPPAQPVRSLTRDFLAWIASRPRTYAEAMEAWRTSCPRLTIWEDAIGDGLVRVESGGTTLREARVVLTPRGRAVVADRPGGPGPSGG